MPVTNLSEASVSLGNVVQILSPVAVAVIGGASWMIKRIIGKLEANVEALHDDLDELETAMHALADKVRAEREAACKEAHLFIEDLRKDCSACKSERIREHTDCVDTYGKFGSRLTKIETEHQLHHKGGL